MQNTGTVTNSKAAGSGQSISVAPDDGTEQNVKNATNLTWATYSGNPDDLHEGDRVQISITKL